MRKLLKNLPSFVRENSLQKICVKEWHNQNEREREKESFIKQLQIYLD